MIVYIGRKITFIHSSYSCPKIN